MSEEDEKIMAVSESADEIIDAAYRLTERDAQWALHILAMQTAEINKFLNKLRPMAKHLLKQDE